MIDNFSGIDTEGGGGGGGGHYGFCHRRLAVMIFFFFKGQIKSPILHNTREGSEFYVFRTICNLGRGLGLWVGWEEGVEESQGSMPAYYEACLKT